MTEGQPTDAEPVAKPLTKYALWKAAGLCTSCGKGRDRPGFKLCARCNGYHVRDREVRKASGLCPCSRSLDVPGWRKCSACNALERDRKAARKAAGLCACGHAKAEPDKKLCRSCLDYCAVHDARRRPRDTPPGVCRWCGRLAGTKRKACRLCMDRANVRARRWAKNNPDKMAVVYAANRCRRASQIAASGGHFTAYQWKALKKQHGYRCLACGRKSPEIRLVADHVKPVCKGGTNDIGNIQPLCAWCNNSKHDDDADYRNGPFAVIRP